jgi:hypothetical protein
MPTDHGTGETGGTAPSAVGSLSNTGASAIVPLAEPLPVSLETPVELTPNPEGDPIPIPLPTLPRPWPWPDPFPLPHLCFIKLPTGCYRITFKPNASFIVYHGAMRVDTANGNTTISGDLYRFLQFPWLFTTAESAKTSIKPFPFPFPFPYGIPIYARNRYYSYLKVTQVQRSPIFTTGPCQLTLTAQEYAYTQPPAGSFDGTFPAAPGSRTVTIVLEPRPAPIGYTGSYFEGTLYEGGIAQGTFTMGWVSSFFRKATLEIDTLAGAVAPAAVSASSGSGTEDFKTTFAAAGWDLNVTYDQVNVPVPAGVTPNACWSSADLHALMSTIRNPATNLDAEWHMHLLVVPATMGCGRGVMYDIIDVPREGVASFCDDGYPSSQSASFGTAANQQQRNVPRAFMRSACHEVGHGFNQIHQEQEAGADNSIMTTTPSVADVLGGPTTGAPGIFPDDIALRFNDHVRHHLVHFPDIVVRPGGMTFGSGHSSQVPEADRYYFSEQELELKLDLRETHIELGEPLQLSWSLLNQSADPIPVPSDISIEAQHTFITVLTPSGDVRPMPSFVIRTEEVSIEPLPSERALQADSRVYWSSQGFAFESPGKYRLEVRIAWTYQGVPCGVKASTDLWVNYPQATADNDAASLLLHPQVGMYVALGGGASHLTDGVSRLERVFAMARERDQQAPKALRGYEGLLPTKKADISPVS